jgi:hypothetical protein
MMCGVCSLQFWVFPLYNFDQFHRIQLGSLTGNRQCNKISINITKVLLLLLSSSSSSLSSPSLLFQTELNDVMVTISFYSLLAIMEQWWNNNDQGKNPIKSETALFSCHNFEGKSH